MDIVLVPGLWLDGSSWDEVKPTLESAGHRTHPVTLPGMEHGATNRAHITLADHIGAVVEVIDGCEDVAQVVLVGHSAGCAVAYGALDERVDRVARVIYIGGFPTGDGLPVVDGYEVRDGEIPFPDWSSFDEMDLVGLDEDGLRRFSERAIASPGRLTSDLQQLRDIRRYEVPVTVIATEFTTQMLREWIADAMAPVAEFPKFTDVEFVDLPTGHWPQFSRPNDLAEIILRIIDVIE